MENPKSALEWLLACKPFENMKIEQYSWIEKVLPEWSDVCVSIDYGPNQIECWGCAPTEDLALSKAISEVVERVSMVDHKFTTSNGMAAHPDASSVKENASLELIERDFFLCHYLTSESFTKIELPPVHQDWVCRAEEWARQNCVELSFFHLGISGCVCTLTPGGGRTIFGLIVASAYSLDLESSMKRAFVEVGRRALINLKAMTTITKEDFDANSAVRFEHHGQLAINPAYSDHYESLFIQKESSKKRTAESCANIHVELISPKSVALKECPLFVARATSSSCQTVWLGPTTKNLINRNRLEEFAGRSIADSEINYWPHPID